MTIPRRRARPTTPPVSRPAGDTAGGPRTPPGRRGAGGTGSVSSHGLAAPVARPCPRGFPGISIGRCADRPADARGGVRRPAANSAQHPATPLRHPPRAAYRHGCAYRSAAVAHSRSARRRRALAGPTHPMVTGYPSPPDIRDLPDHTPWPRDESPDRARSCLARAESLPGPRPPFVLHPHGFTGLPAAPPSHTTGRYMS